MDSNEDDHGAEDEPIMRITSTRKEIMMRSPHSIQSSSEIENDRYGETLSPPADLKDDWAYISAKNASKRAEHATSNVDTLIHLLKGNIGTGLLALPFAVSEAGFILGPVGILIFGVIATHCMILLVDSARKLCKENDFTSLDYAETMQFAIARNVGRTRFSSKTKARISKAAKLVVNVFLIITQFGFCSVYFVFIANTLQQVTEDMYCFNLDYRLWILFLIIPITVFSWIRNLDNLASLSALANMCILIGLIIILYDEIDKFAVRGVHEAAIEKGHLTEAGHPLALAMFFGTSVFAFEGIGVILPLENKMKQPENAKSVIYTGMTIITILYSVFGLIGYLVYGNDVMGSVTLSLCGTNGITSFVFAVTKMLFAVNIFVSYLIQFYVPMDFLEPHVFRIFRTNYISYKYPVHGNKIKLLIQLGFRSILVLVTAIFAISVPNIELLITLVGAGASSGLAFIFPPIIRLLAFRKISPSEAVVLSPVRRVLSILVIIKDIAIITLGVGGFVFGSFAAMYSIVKAFEHPGSSTASCDDGAMDFRVPCQPESFLV